MTPILGLDTLMQHNLSLSFEHDQRFLVNKAGQRTQLEHMGRHLYLVASPFQHGLSTCFSGSLSDVIGLLPEDKELHEQEIALGSSSSTDLVEDQKQEQDEQDSLNFQCHSVLHASFQHVKDSFVCVLCEEEVAVSGGELSDTSFHPFQQPKKPSSQDKQLHNKHPRSCLHWSVELEEARSPELIHALSSACVYELPDIAWHNPALLFRGQCPSQLSRQKNPGKRMTNKLAAQQDTRHSELQVDTGAESSKALLSVLSSGSLASFGGASLGAPMVQQPVPRQLASSENFKTCLRRKLQRDWERALQRTASKQSVQSLYLNSFQCPDWTWTAWSSMQILAFSFRAYSRQSLWQLIL